MNTKIIKTYKTNLKLTKLQREIIIGLMLGDGHLETQNNGKTYRLKVEYGERQKSYIDWIWNIFKEWTRTSPQLKSKKSQSGKIIKSYYFNTYSHNAFRFYGHQFYHEKTKIIPKIIGKLLSPLSIAVWFMDDGSWKSNKHRTYILHVDGYKKKELANSQKVLKIKFGIETTLHHQYKNWRIYVKTSSAEKFKNLVSPYVISEMTYKLGNTMPKE